MESPCTQLKAAVSDIQGRAIGLLYGRLRCQLYVSSSASSANLEEAAWEYIISHPDSMS